MSVTPQQTYRFGLIGYPLGHSLSPLLHQAALKAQGLEGTYHLFSIPTDAHSAVHLQALLQRLRNEELHGLNITIPYKQAVIPFLDELSPAASAIGAVNTIRCSNGRLIGENTDAPGLAADLAHLVQKPAAALVLGAGGAARAAVYALASTGWQVSVASRRLEQARQLAQDLHTAVKRPIHFALLSPEVLGDLAPGVDLILNATPVGMTPAVDASPWPEQVPLPPQAAVYDMVYNPAETRLLRAARAAGMRVRGGIGMLIEQAALAFEAWTGRHASRSAMHAALAEHGLAQALPSGSIL
jgi:shikimate dehydrogenase